MCQIGSGFCTSTSDKEATEWEKISHKSSCKVKCDKSTSSKEISFLVYFEIYSYTIDYKQQHQWVAAE